MQKESAQGKNCEELHESKEALEKKLQKRCKVVGILIVASVAEWGFCLHCCPPAACPDRPTPTDLGGGGGRWSGS